MLSSSRKLFKIASNQAADKHRNQTKQNLQNYYPSNQQRGRRVAKFVQTILIILDTRKRNQK